MGKKPQQQQGIDVACGLPSREEALANLPDRSCLDALSNDACLDALSASFPDETRFITNYVAARCNMPKELKPGAPVRYTGAALRSMGTVAERHGRLERIEGKWAWVLWADETEPQPVAPSAIEADPRWRG